jgi:hypothetical protein
MRAARPRLVRRGFLFPRGEKEKRSHAAMGVAAIFKPEMAHVIEEERSQAIIREDDETGESLRLDLE